MQGVASQIIRPGGGSERLRGSGAGSVTAGDGRWRWGMLLLAPALLIALASVGGGGGVLYGVVREAFGVLCHQLPERSYAIAGTVVVVCARCTGFYAGLAAIGAAGAVAGRFGVRWYVNRAWFLLVLPLAIDGTANLLGLWNTPAAVRSATGLSAAVPVAAALMGGGREAN